MSEDVKLNPYFERIGFAGSIAPTLQTLQALHIAHPSAIPFENLNPLLGLPVPLDLRSLEQKLVSDHRGGYCYEQNTFFLHVLRSLGYEVKPLGARVLWGRAGDTPVARTHMLLNVEITGVNYIADVGFGGNTPTAPLRLRTDIEQETPIETYRLVGGDPVYRLEVKLGEDWRALYSFDLSEQLEPDFEIASWWMATHPDSTMRKRLAAARTDRKRRHTLDGAELSTYEPGIEPQRRTLATVGELRDALTGVFGLVLPPADVIDPLLERTVAAGGQA